MCVHVCLILYTYMNVIVFIFMCVYVCMCVSTAPDILHNGVIACEHIAKQQDF